MPNIESRIKAQRILCIKKFLDTNPAGWNVSSSFISKRWEVNFYQFHCNFDLTKLSIALPDFYKEVTDCHMLLRISLRHEGVLESVA